MDLSPKIFFIWYIFYNFNFDVVKMLVLVKEMCTHTKNMFNFKRIFLLGDIITSTKHTSG